MEPKTASQLRRAYKQALLFWGIGTIGPLPIYVVILFVVLHRLGYSGPSPIKPEYAYLILLGLAALTAATIKPVGRLNLLRNATTTFTTIPFLRLSAEEMRMFGATGTISAMTHTLAVVGFVLAFLTGMPRFLYIGILLALALMVAYFPRFDQWVEWWKELVYTEQKPPDRPNQVPGGSIFR